MKFCIVTGCGNTTSRTRCPAHERAHDATRRPLAKARGYDREFKKARARAIREYGGTCAACGLPPTPSDPLTGGHVKPRSQGGTVADGILPLHRSCNSRMGTRTLDY